MGIGAGRQRWRHVSWGVVRGIGFAWLTTMPAAAILAIVAIGAIAYKVLTTEVPIDEI